MESLGQFKWFGDDVFFFFIVLDFGVIGKREVFVERVVFEVVIGQDMVEIGVVGEEDVVQVVYFMFVLVGVIEEVGDIGNGGGFVGVGFDVDVRVVVDGKKVVDDFEMVFVGWVVSSGDGVYLGEFGSGVV